MRVRFGYQSAVFERRSEGAALNQLTTVLTRLLGVCSATERG